MPNWIRPQFSKNRVKQAGKRIRAGAGTSEDSEVLENWRAAHAYVINTFQANLRRRARNRPITVGQRLKRRPTIIDKLKREPNMQLSTMHDIAGCRAIFESIDDLYDFRSSLQSSRAKHELLTAGTSKFDYLVSPKETGYRGIHDVYRYSVSSATGVEWNGLQIEVQYRTSAQHAWATAVETADLLLKTRAKFDEGSENYKNFWRYASEIIARHAEGANSCLASMPNETLISDFLSLEDELHVLRLLREANRFSPLIARNALRIFPRRRRNTILVYQLDNSQLRVLSFENMNLALKKYSELETELADSAEIVLVRAEDRESILKVFQNYFSNTQEFLDLIDGGTASLV